MFTALHALVLVATPLQGAQLEAPPTQTRYEVGRRTIAMERAWAAAPTERRGAAVEPLKNAVGLFFRLQLDEAGREIDAARQVLLGAPGVDWTDALALTPERWLLATDSSPFVVGVRLLYVVELPSSARLGLGEARWPLGELPLAFELARRPAGEAELDFVLYEGDEPVGSVVVPVAFAADPAGRVERLQRFVRETKRERALDLELATLDHQVKLLDRLLDGKPQETYLPGTLLLAEAEALRAAVETKRAHYGGTKPGDLRLAVPLTEEKGRTRTQIVRLVVPPDLSPDERVPLVIAVHGAGGSENMFIEAYGAGAIVQLCRERGWLLASPKLGLRPSLPAAHLARELAERFPVDLERVVLVGHSLGAAAVVAAGATDPTSFAALVALGGGRPIQDPTPLLDAPLWIGAGADDFGLPGARALHASLKELGHERLVWREVTPAEHLSVVQQALPDVFRWLDERVATD